MDNHQRQIEQIKFTFEFTVHVFLTQVLKSQNSLERIKVPGRKDTYTSNGSALEPGGPEITSHLPLPP